MKEMIFFVWLLLIVSCTKKETTPGPVTPPVDTTTKPPIDPGIANTIGFFLDDWAPKNFTAPAYEDVPKPAETATKAERMITRKKNQHTTKANQ